MVGFYGNDRVLIGESTSPIHPFIIVLSDLILWIKDTEQADEAIKSLTIRLDKAREPRRGKHRRSTSMETQALQY